MGYNSIIKNQKRRINGMKKSINKKWQLNTNEARKYNRKIERINKQERLKFLTMIKF